MAQLYSIELTSQAEAAYRQLVERARRPIERGEASNAHVKTLRMVDELLDKIIPHNPFDISRALSGKLNNIYRVKKGRLRICYIGSPEERRITILYIADTPRKQGDKNDPYTVLTKLVGSGQFDQLYAALGLPSPGNKLSAVAAAAGSIVQ